MSLEHLKAWCEGLAAISGLLAAIAWFIAAAVFPVAQAGPAVYANEAVIAAIRAQGERVRRGARCNAVAAVLTGVSALSTVVALYASKVLAAGGQPVLAVSGLGATDQMTLLKFLSSGSFWPALFGALTAFVLARVADWRKSVSAMCASGNVAIITLAEMYSEAKALDTTIFVQPLAKLLKLLGRQPLYFEFLAAVDVPTDAPKLDIDGLSFLAGGHDPDVLVRLIGVRNNFGAMLKLAASHVRLHGELQTRMAKIDPSGQTPYSASEIPNLVGADVMLQLKSTVEGLQELLPELIKSLQIVSEQLRDVLLYRFPTKTFIKFIAEDRGKLSEAKVYAAPPARWRRVVRRLRALFDHAFGPRWPKS
jgi:hypothetical protein